MRPTTPLDDVMAAVRPVADAHGFRTNGRVFRRRSEGVVLTAWVHGFATNRFARDDDPIDFRVELSAYVPEVDDLLGRPRESNPRGGSWYPQACLDGTDVGNTFVVSSGQGRGTDVVGPIVAERFAERAMPWFEARRSPEAIGAAWPVVPLTDHQVPQVERLALDLVCGVATDWWETYLDWKQRHGAARPLVVDSIEAELRRAGITRPT